MGENHFPLFDNPFHVGNWVYDITGHLMLVTGCQGNFIHGYYVDDEGIIHKSTCRADAAGCVEMTEETLTKAGFIKNKYGFWYLYFKDKRIQKQECVSQMLSLVIPHIGFNPDEKFLKIRKSNGVDMYVPCEFFHQLQNALELAGLQIDFELLEPEKRWKLNGGLRLFRQR